MTYADSRTLIEYSKLQLEIALSKTPAPEQLEGIAAEDRWLSDVERATLRKNADAERRAGVRAMRQFIDHLSPRARAKHMSDMRAQLGAVRALVARAKASGEPVNLADLTIETREEGQGAP